MKNKFKIATLLFFATSFTLGACSDWTDIEGIDIKQPNIQEQNPELYTKYLENLCEYKKNQEHKLVYAWFDNSEKVPYNRGQHMSDLPDSIDIVILTHPKELVPFEREEIKILKDKGTKVAYAVSYDDIKAKYDEEQITASQIQMKENSENTFDGFLREEVKKQLAYSETFDGVIIKFNGKNPKYMTDEDRVSYEATQEVFFNTISEWEKENKNKFLSFQGKPQNIIKKEQLSRFLHIIIEFYQVTDVNKFSLTIQDCLEPGVPTDRFIMAVSTPSLDSSDTTTGYLGKELATVETAYWITSISSEYNKSGIAIDNVQNDYYQTNGTYRNVKEVINIMNPAPIK